MEPTQIITEVDPKTKTRQATFNLGGSLHRLRWRPENEDAFYNNYGLEFLQLLVEMLSSMEHVPVSIVDLGESEDKYVPMPEVSYHVWKNYTARQVLLDFGFSVNEKMI